MLPAALALAIALQAPAPVAAPPPPPPPTTTTTTAWEQARLALGLDVVDGRGTAYCDPARGMFYGAADVLCASQPQVTSGAWRAPGKDDSWTVQIDVVTLKDAATAAAARAGLVGLTSSSAAIERSGARGKAPRLSWCETSYAFFGDDTVVVASVACGARRPYCSVTRALLERAVADDKLGGARGVLGFEGGSATPVRSLSTLSRCTQGR